MSRQHSDEDARGGRRGQRSVEFLVNAEQGSSIRITNNIPSHRSQ